MRWSLNYLSVRLVSVCLSACLENYPTIRDHPLANLLTETVTPRSNADFRGQEHV
ncbi:hypothetical protein K438DRAFT_1847152 [Mycena galopus ATCC 62051]|nr:hypothetical protein K438DRAFT_1847152 [Mycena galopus ATCC 62051]